MYLEEPAAPAAVRVRLLGPPALQHGAAHHPFPPERPYLLLAFLAARRDWVRRDELADLLYPGRDLDGARSNLRKVIFLARKVPGVGDLEQRADLLRWAPASDLADFDAACDQRRWADAVASYGGALLLGLDGAWPAAAADWLDGERQRLQARWHEACTRRLAELAADPAAARKLAETMLRHDPLDDVALLALGRAQKALGQADAALRTLADFRDRLARDLGLAPSAALHALDAEIRSGAPPAAPAPPPGLVGRRQERQQVRDRLSRPDCRVLTLQGPPGVGKSTLARALADELGGRWVPLEDLPAAGLVPERIATVLGLALDTARAPWDALAHALAGQSPLLVLDNAEHLPMAAELGALLAAVPGLRVLAASRAPLGVSGEWRLPIDGLPLPDTDETDPDVLQANDAVQLFVRRALPLAPQFDLRAEAADVVRLLHEVAGLPLAIELLAAWRRLMPVREILAELAASLDVLEASQPNERSVRAGFARAWQQLGPVEQRVLSQMALLPAPLDRELLRGALQAPLPVLAALADRSLVQADGEGLFTLHPLIRRCAAPLAADADAVHERHARHVASTRVGEAAAGDDALPHLRAAWQWALDRGDETLLAALSPTLWRQFTRRSLWREGQRAMRALEQLLRPRLPEAAPARALCVALVQLASLCYQCGELDDAQQAATEAAALARQLGDARQEALASARLGAVHWQRGDFAAARTAFSHQVALLAAQPDADVELASAEAWVALVDKAQGRYDDALQRYRRSAALLRQAGKLHMHLYLLNNLGNLLRTMQRLAEAAEVLQEGLQLAREHGSLEDEPFLLTNLAIVLEDMGRPEAATWAERAVASAAEHGEPMIEGAARMARARCAAMARRDAAAVLPDILAALSIADRLQAPPLKLEALMSAGVALAHAGRLAAGVALVRWAQAQPESTLADREDADRRLARAPGAISAMPDPALPPLAPVDDALALLQRAARP